MATPAQKKLVRKRLADIREAKNARFKWPKWIGFSGKTLWDCLNLFAALAIPLVVVLATIGFGSWQAQLADMQHQNDLKIADDQQQEATLKAYLDDMTTLLLDKKLGSPAKADKAASDEAAVAARAKTLIALRRLTDPLRKAIVVQFLYEAQLIGYLSCEVLVGCSKVVKLVGSIIDLHGADLRGADLHDADLRGAFLRGADLQYADLGLAYLGYADLRGAFLRGANLHTAFYNTKTIHVKDAQGNSLTIEPTQWSQGFDPKAAGAICVDC